MSHHRAVLKRLLRGMPMAVSAFACALEACLLPSKWMPVAYGVAAMASLAHSMIHYSCHMSPHGAIKPHPGGNAGEVSPRRGLRSQVSSAREGRSRARSVDGARLPSGRRTSRGGDALRGANAGNNPWNHDVAVALAPRYAGSFAAPESPLKAGLMKHASFDFTPSSMGNPPALTSVRLEAALLASPKGPYEAASSSE